jgi:hypothetical protein
MRAQASRQRQACVRQDEPSRQTLHRVTRWRQRERPETTMTTTGFFHDYEIVQSAYDPNRSWELVVAASHGPEVARIRFRTYGDAWREAERLKAAESEPENPAAERPISKRSNVSAPEHDIPQFPGSA